MCDFIAASAPDDVIRDCGWWHQFWDFLGDRVEMRRAYFKLGPFLIRSEAIPGRPNLRKYVYADFARTYRSLSSSLERLRWSMDLDAETGVGFPGALSLTC